MTDPVVVTIQRIETYGHGYFKVSLELLDDLNIINYISEYSYLGFESFPLNERQYAYLEEDSDFGLFHKAMEYYKKEYKVDEDTLTDLFNEQYEDDEDWIDELSAWDIELICDHWGYYANEDEDLALYLFDNEEELDEEELDEEE